MTLLVLRLAGSLQSWSGYRHQLNINAAVPTESLPRKSAISGLIGAALGPKDRGHGSARDLEAVATRYRLHIRVEARNPTTEDFQVLGSLPPRATPSAERHHRLTTASAQAFPSKRGQGNFETTVSRKDYLAHSEFTSAIETDEETARAWLDALREPVFMPYLGRKSCAPAFPFILGLSEGTVANLFSTLPHVEKHPTGSGSAKSLVGYEVTGDYDLHRTLPHPSPYAPPTLDRQSQLAWAKEQLQ